MDGNPVPWINYSAINFLDLFAPRTGKVFEYGMGMSTLWWLNRGLTVFAVESKAEWAVKVDDRYRREFLVGNKLYYRIEKGLDEYYKAVHSYEDTFDVIVVDGEMDHNIRFYCLQEAKKKLSDKGLIVIDNIDWISKTRHNAVLDTDFVSIPISGFVPGLPYSTTALFMFKDVTVLQERMTRFLSFPYSPGAIKQEME